MKLKTTSIGVLVGLGMHIACAGEPDPRFYGVWGGVETYHIWAHGGPGGQWGQAPVKQSAEIGVGDSGKVFAVGQGFGRGRYEISPRWGRNTLNFQVISGPSLYTSRTYEPMTYFGRDHGKLVLS